MAPIEYISINILEENSIDLYIECVEILIKIARNVLQEPLNPKFRSLSLKSNIITRKLLSTSGAMECLFEMGFQEGEDTLILPEQTPLDPIKYIHDELVKRVKQRKIHIKKTIHLSNESRAFKITQALAELENQTTNSFFKQMIIWCFYVLKYENYELQKKALSLIPLAELNLNVLENIRKIQLEYKKMNICEEIIDYQELFLIQLCKWFNNDFFTWVDTPKCTKCGFIETIHEGISSDVIPGADRVEKYKCQKCSEIVLFPRYNDPNKLLDTRRGRCGEWANSFCCFCRALGWDTRLVFDKTDHVWTEIYSVVQSRWIHCDPCENAVDTPLMYESGWKKKLSYIFAYSIDEIQDVTWRYSGKHKQVLDNRNKCSEIDLVNFIIKVRNIMLNYASNARKNFVIKRTCLELVELMIQNFSSDSETKGRISGSLAWRLSRGETSDETFKPHIWIINKEDIQNNKFQLSYITSKDIYIKNSKCAIKNWKNGVYQMDSIFKKDEKDWKMSYLARQENAEKGLVSWRFELHNEFSVGMVDLKLISQTFEGGIVLSRLCSGHTCVHIPNGIESFSTDAFIGCKSLELIVELFGGSFWQHAQILRQSFFSEEPTLQIILSLTETLQK